MTDSVQVKKLPFVCVPLSWLKRLRPSEMAVAIAIAGHADRHGAAWPSIRLLCEETGLSRNALKHALVALSEKGVLTVEPRKRPNGSDSSHIYTLDMTGGFSVPEPEAAPQGEGSKNDPPRGQKMTGEGSEIDPWRGQKLTGEGSEIDPQRTRSIELDPFEPDPVKVEPTPSGSPISLPAWDSLAVRYQQMPWEDSGKRLDEGFVTHLTELWTTPERNAVKAGLMARQFLRKARQSEDAYLRAVDAWELYQSSRQEQAQKAQQNAEAEAEAAELRKWMRQGY